MNVCFITSKTGERMAILPAEEFERLVDVAEMALDVTAYDEVKQRLARGEEELLPASLADRILHGESPVKVFRAHRGFSAIDVARRAGIARAYLSQIESGARQGSLSTMRALVDILGVMVDDLV